MIVFRICANKWANSLSGKGAELYGGRWNSKGTPMLYTSENISLAMLEILVQAQGNQLKSTFSLVEIQIPDSSSVITKSLDELPSNWNAYPHERATQQLGDS